VGSREDGTGRDDRARAGADRVGLGPEFSITTDVLVSEQALPLRIPSIWDVVPLMMPQAFSVGGDEDEDVGEVGVLLLPQPPDTRPASSTGTARVNRAGRARRPCTWRAGQRVLGRSMVLSKSIVASAPVWPWALTPSRILSMSNWTDMPGAEV
jgi:hypothetical protein